MRPNMHRLRYLYLAHFSQPAADRPLYRRIRRQKVRRIVELGVGLLTRATRMIEVAAAETSPENVTYTGVDLFELRSAADCAGVSLKLAHRQLMPTGARIRLLPGDPFTALSRAANELTETDLLVISANQDAQSLAKAWFYVPRMLHARSQVLVERCKPGDGTSLLEAVSRAEIDAWAGVGMRRRAA
jgi:hypothetical protein